MDFDVLFSIGELAKICKVTPKTLRFYDKLGLLKPAIVNPQNGYRFYTRWHITRVTTIKQLQDTGIKLDDIHTFFEQKDSTNVVESLSELLNSQKDIIENQIIELTKQLKTLQSLQLNYQKIKGQITYDDSSGIIIREIPKRTILYIAYQGEYTSTLFRQSYQEILSTIKLDGYHWGEIELSGPLAIFAPTRSLNNHDTVNIKFGYEINNQPSQLSLPTFCIDKALYACYVYKGPYAWIKSELYRVIYENIEKMGYQILAPQLEYYYINEAIADKDTNYLTEIQIPIKVTKN